MRLKNAIVKTTFFSHGPFRSKFAGNRAHGRSECEEARSSALPFRSKRRKSAARGRADSNDRWLLSAGLQRSAAVIFRALNKNPKWPKLRYGDFPCNRA